MGPIPKTLISLGIFLIVVGIFWYVGSKWIPLGKLPGDLVIERQNVKISFPWVTSIVVSVLASALIYFIKNLFKGS